MTTNLGTYNCCCCCGGGCAVGTRIQLATWMAAEGATASPAGSTSMLFDKIATVQVVSAATGDVLMQRSL